MAFSKVDSSKRRIAVVCSALATSAFFLATGACDLFALKYLRVTMTRHDASSAREEIARALSHGRAVPDAHAILRRNIFDPKSGALWPPRPASSHEADLRESGFQPSDAEKFWECDGPLRVIAAVVSSQQPSSSFASLSMGVAPALVYWPGDFVDDKRVDSIYPESVVLRTMSGDLCLLSMFSRPRPIRGLSATAEGGIVTVPEEELDQNITQVGDTKFHVQRRFFERVFSNPTETKHLAHAARYEENGKAAGLRLFDIHRSSFLGKLGLYNGDVVRSINGHELSSIADASQFYGKLSDAGAMAVVISRRGSELAFEYELR